MKLLFFVSLIALFALSASAFIRPKRFIVTYPNDTPEAAITEAKDQIKRMGGFIVHEYHLIKGFAAQAQPKVLDRIYAISEKYDAMIEEDNVLHPADESY